MKLINTLIYDSLNSHRKNNQQKNLTSKKTTYFTLKYLAGICFNGALHFLEKTKQEIS